jgi:NH3-dependent NAD+ synthetase
MSAAEPPSLDLATTFNALVDWIRDDIGVRQKAPGLLVGISGTDSALVFLACAKAFEPLGRPVVGVHFGPRLDGDGPDAKPEPKTLDQMKKTMPGQNWVVESLLPWLREQAPKATVTVDSSINYFDDYQRWAALFSHAVNLPAGGGACAVKPLAPEETKWIVGTRNATEQALGAYSNVSGAVSVQPIIHLWKSEVLELCEYLKVPSVAISKSRLADCACHRFQFAAEHIEEIDWALMARRGTLSGEFLKKNVDADDLKKVEAFVDEQIRDAGFKNQIPYLPPAAVMVRK